MSDFKFSVKDKIVYEGIRGEVIKVLDEMILVEYDKSMIIGKKMQELQWVETDSKNLEILKLV